MAHRKKFFIGGESMFDKDWWEGNFEENTLTYAEYGHRTQSGCLYVWLLGGDYVPLTVEPVGEQLQNLRPGEKLAIDLRLFLLDGSVIFRRGEEDRSPVGDKGKRYTFSQKFGGKGEGDFKEICRSLTCTVLEVSYFEQEDGKRWYKLDLLYSNYYVFHAVAGDGFGEYGIRFGDELLLHKVAICGKVKRWEE